MQYPPSPPRTIYFRVIPVLVFQYRVLAAADSMFAQMYALRRRLLNAPNFVCNWFLKIGQRSGKYVTHSIVRHIRIIESPLSICNVFYLTHTHVQPI